MKFKIFGIEFEISFLFTVMLCVIILTDKSGTLHWFFLSSFIHEISHLITMSALKAKPSAIRLIAGGINIVDSNVKSNLSDMLILISGPLSNLMCFLIFKGEFSEMSLMLFIFNMLPIQSLDGGRILFIILISIMSYGKAEILLNFFTIVLSITLVLLFFYLLFEGEKNYSLLIFSLYIISSLFCKKVLKEK